MAFIHYVGNNIMYTDYFNMVYKIRQNMYINRNKSNIGMLVLVYYDWGFLNIKFEYFANMNIIYMYTPNWIFVSSLIFFQFNFRSSNFFFNESIVRNYMEITGTRQKFLHLLILHLLIYIFNFLLLR